MEYTAGCCCVEAQPIDCPGWFECLPDRIRIRLIVEGRRDLSIGDVPIVENTWSYDWDMLWKREVVNGATRMIREQATLTWSTEGRRWYIDNSIYPNTCFIPCPSTGPFGYLQREEIGGGVYLFPPNAGSTQGGLLSPLISCASCPGNPNQQNPIRPLSYLQTGESANLPVSFTNYNPLGSIAQQGTLNFKAYATLQDAEPGCLKSLSFSKHYVDASIRRGPGTVANLWPTIICAPGSGIISPCNPITGYPQDNSSDRSAACGELCGAVWCVNQSTGKLIYGCGCGGPVSPAQPPSLWNDRSGIVPFVQTVQENSNVNAQIV